MYCNQTFHTKNDGLSVDPLAIAMHSACTGEIHALKTRKSSCDGVKYDKGNWNSPAARCGGPARSFVPAMLGMQRSRTKARGMNETAGGITEQNGTVNETVVEKKNYRPVQNQ